MLFCVGKVKAFGKKWEKLVENGNESSSSHPKEIALTFHRGNGPHKMTTIKAFIQ
jgi:hypothetical protein